MTKSEYHVGCGAFGIYAGILDKSKTRWLHKSDVTDECVSAAAEYLLKTDQSMKFSYDGKDYVLKVEEV
mgnify:FL=1